MRRRSTRKWNTALNDEDGSNDDETFAAMRRCFVNLLGREMNLRPFFFVILLLQLVNSPQPAPPPSSSTPAPVVVSDLTVSQSGSSIIWLAMINVSSLAVLAVIARWADSRKDRASAKAIADAAEQAAQIKAEEKKLDWARQDAVAERVQTAATQAATTAQLLLSQQQDARHRQDVVAEQVQAAATQAAKAAVLLAAAQDQMSRATKEVARLAAETDTRVQSQLKTIEEQGRKIHVLVNSDMTAARTAERDSLKLLVISLRNALALSTKLGLPISGSESEEIANAQKRIAELNQILEDRHQAQLMIDRETTAAAAAVHQDPQTTKVLKEIASNTAAIAENTNSKTD
jgi:hypothetical protein